MWFETQHSAMMGVQVTASKRKLHTAATAGSDSCPAKAGRWESAGTEDCIARLQAVAVPSDAWRPTSVPPPTTTTTTTYLCADEFDDDDEFEEELSDDDRCSLAPADAIRYQSLTYEYQHPLHHHHHHQSPTSSPAPAAAAAVASSHQVRSSYTGTWQYYAPPATQQTIRCEENGKSYLELGAAPAPVATTAATTTRVRCCDGRTRWCNVPCYRQRRLAVLNLSMCKLARYRQCSDPSLRRSVLICNTLRHIEREMEAEGQQPHPPEPCYTTPPPAPPPASTFTECTPQHTTSSGPHQVLSGRPAAVLPVSAAQLDPYEHSLREFASPSGRVTPFPVTTTDTDSGIGEEDAGRSINWGSVLSLTSQTDLEPLNNNELYAELGLSSGDLQEWKDQPQHGEWDSFMHVLVGGS